MAKQKLDQYSGKLTPSQITDGINAAQKNAQRLAADARLLCDAKRYPTAASLAILAIEEVGKSRILRQLSTAETDGEIRTCWKEYRSHTKKNILWLLPQFVAKGARHLSDFAPLFQSDSEYPFLADMMKQIGFYTDCLGKAHWAIPTDAIDEKATLPLVITAEILSKQTYEITTREIELWIEYMLPVKHKDLVTQKKAVSDWYAALQTEGLIEPGENGMEQFVFGTK